MKLLINTATTLKGGSVQVALSFIEECKAFEEHNYHVVLSEGVSGFLKREHFPSNFTFYDIGYRPSQRVFSIQSKDRFFKELEGQIEPDVVFTTSGPAYWQPQAPHVVGYNLPHYIYSESPYFQIIPLHEKLKWTLKGRLLKYFLKKEADAFVVQTDDVNRRLQRWMNVKNIFTVSNTCSSAYFSDKVIPEKLPKPQENEFRFLTLSSYYPHKNIELIREVIDSFDTEYAGKVRFVVTLPSDIYRRIFPPKYRKIVYNTGPVPADECPSLYKECDAVFLPTLLECFSAAYPEAMAMEKPILTSDLGFARSICGEGALYFEPMNANSAFKKIKEIVSNENLQHRLIEKSKKRLPTFDSAVERAEKYLEICEQIL
jgi:glycosyltransferase involved in cell wall biosynthesis